MRHTGSRCEYGLWVLYSSIAPSSLFNWNCYHCWHQVMCMLDELFQYGLNYNSQPVSVCYYIILKPTNTLYTSSGTPITTQTFNL